MICLGMATRLMLSALDWNFSTSMSTPTESTNDVVYSRRRKVWVLCKRSTHKVGQHTAMLMKRTVTVFESNINLPRIVRPTGATGRMTTGDKPAKATLEAGHISRFVRH